MMSHKFIKGILTAGLLASPILGAEEEVVSSEGNMHVSCPQEEQIFNEEKNFGEQPLVSVEALQQQIEELTGQVTSLSAAKEELDASVFSFHSQIEELTGQVTSLSAAKEELTASVSNYHSQIEELTGQVTSLSTEKEELTGQVTSLSTEKEELTASVSNYKSQIETLYGRNKALADHIRGALNLNLEFLNELGGDEPLLSLIPANELNQLNAQLETSNAKIESYKGFLASKAAEMNEFNA